MKRSNGSQNFDLDPEFCGQGVCVSSVVNIKAGGNAFIKTTVKDGNGMELGQCVLNEDIDTYYFNLEGVSKMKRQTLINVVAKLKESLEAALAEQLAEQDDGNGNGQTGDTPGNGDAEPADGGE